MVPEEKARNFLGDIGTETDRRDDDDGGGRRRNREEMERDLKRIKGRLNKQEEEADIDVCMYVCMYVSW